MKSIWACIALFLCLAGLFCVGADNAGKFFPDSFSSTEAATAWAHALFADGDVEVLKVGSTDVLVVFAYGSGVPEVGIAAYQMKTGRWIFVTEMRPPPTEFHKAIVSGHEIVIVGEKTQQQWTLLKLD